MKKLSRRNFLRMTGTLGFTAMPAFTFITYAFQIPGKTLKSCPTASFSYFRDQDLLDIQFHFLNGEIKSGKIKRSQSEYKAYMVVQLPQQHLTESTFSEKEFNKLRNDRKFVPILIAGASYLVFELVAGEIALSPKELLNWNNVHSLKLMTATRESAFYNKPGSDSAQITTAQEPVPLTTIEAPVGFFMAPFTQSNQTIIFSKANTLSKPAESAAFNVTALITDALKNVGKTGLDPTRVLQDVETEKNRKHAGKPLSITAATEIWNNDLVVKETGKSISLKLVDTTMPDEPIDGAFPSFMDQVWLSRQFRGVEAWNKQELINVYSPFYKVTGLGIYAKIQYQASQYNALIQKWRQEMVLGRDQFLEIEYLGYLFPFTCRAAIVKVGERKIENGFAYIDRKWYIKVIDKSIRYRLATEQDVGDNGKFQDTVLVPHEDPLKQKISAMKRFIPFQTIEVQTEVSIPIKNPDEAFQTIVSADSDMYKQIMDDVHHVKNILSGGRIELKTLFSILRAEYDVRLLGKTVFESSFWLNTPDWIRQSILNCTDFDKNFDKVIKILTGTNLSEVLKYQIFFFEFKDFLSSAKSWDWPVYTTMNTQKLEQAIQEGEQAISVLVKDVSAAYARQPDYSFVDFQNAFADEANALPEKFDFSKALKDITEQADKARELFTYYSEKFITAYRKYLDAQPDNANSLAAFQEKIQQHWSKCSRLVSVVDTQMEAARETVLAFWPEALNPGGKNKDEFKAIVFSFLAKDWDGNTSQFTAPFIFLKHEAVRQTEQLVEQANTELMKLGKSVLTAETFLQEKGTEMAARVQALRAQISSLATPDQLDKLVQDATEVLAYQKVQALLDRCHLVDDCIKEQYQRVSTQALRQLDLSQQKVAFYKSQVQDGLDKTKEAAKSVVSTVETQILEFTSVPIANMIILNKQMETATDQLSQDLKNKFTVGYTQLAALKGKAGGQLKEAWMRYGDAFYHAGLEIIDDTQQRKNVEKILFEIQAPLNDYIGDVWRNYRDRRNLAATSILQFQNYLDSQNAKINNARTMAQQQWQNLLSEIKSRANEWHQAADQQLEAQYQSVRNFAAGELRNMFSDASAQLAGVITPDSVITVVSTLDNAYTLVKARVNKYTGAIDNVIQAEKTKVDATKQQSYRYLNDVNSDLDKRVKDLFGDLKVFGINIGNQLRSNLPLDKLPRTASEIIYQEKLVGVVKVQVPQALRTVYNWKADKGDDLFVEGSLFKNHGTNASSKTALSLEIENILKLDHSVKTSADIQVADFGLNIQIGNIDLLTIFFDSVRFENQYEAINGDTSTTSHTYINVGSVRFSYFLDLVKKLQEFLGIKDGFVVDISSRGILVSLGLRLPTISTGPFTITNANIFIGTRLPLLGGKDDRPSIRFAFSERVNPFTLAVGIFGGRGFVAMEADACGLRVFEASLEFGGYLGLNFGVASGQAYLMAGIYFKKEVGRGAYVEAYIVCGGCLNVLGLIQASVVFYMGLGYQDGGLVGRASVTVSVSLLFFSASFTLSFEKRISGSGNGIGFTKPQSYYDDLAYQPYSGDKNLHGPNAGEWDGLSAYDVGDKRDTGELVYKIKNGPDDEPVLVQDPTILFSHKLKNNDAHVYQSKFIF